MAEKGKEKETKPVAPWRPLRNLTRWDRDIERMMEDFFGRRTRPSDGPRDGLATTKWRLALRPWMFLRRRMI